MIKPCPFCGEPLVYVEFVKTSIVQHVFYGDGGSPWYESETRALSERPVSEVKCVKCNYTRLDLHYDEHANRVEGADIAVVPEWYAALPEWHAKGGE